VSPNMSGQWFHTALSALFVLRVAVAVALTKRRREVPPLEAPSLIDERLAKMLQEIRQTTMNEGRN